MSKIVGRRYAIGHKSRSGKDTFANVFEELVNAEGGPGVIRISFATPLYEALGAIQRIAGVIAEGDPPVKDPAALQTLGDLMRSRYGADVFVRIARDRACEAMRDPDANIVFTDMRFNNEKAMLEELGFVTVRVTRPDRPIDRDPNHQSEIELDGAEYDTVIHNTGSLEEYRAMIEGTIRHHWAWREYAHVRV